MDNVTILARPVLKRPALVVAFGGWPDAGTVATMSVRYLRERLGASLLGEIRAEEFYIFTQLRPLTTLGDNPWERHISWPSNEIHFWRAPETEPDLLLMLGVEPHLKWRTYIDAILDLAQEFSVERVVSLGATLDSVPHTVEPLISGASSDPQLREALKVLSVRPSGYEGPTSIHSALLDGCNLRGIANASLWGHAPLYLQDTPNPRVSYALLRRLVALLNLSVDLDSLRDAASDFDRQVDEAVAKNTELVDYVKQLEEAMEQPPTPSEDMPSPEAIVEDLEEYLRRRRKGRKNGGGRPDES